MVQVLTILSILAIVAYTVWRHGQAARRRGVDVTIRLDHGVPGAHLIWDIVNHGPDTATVTKLIVHGPIAPIETPLGTPKTLAPQDHLVIPTDVDWSLLAARSVAAIDARGQEHAAARSQLLDVQNTLRQLIDRRVYVASARDFLSGAADLAFGVVILGLGFFMLMWVIATG